MTRSTQACFLAADRQCTELPLLRLPRLVPEFRGSDPMRQTRDLARVGWRGLAPFLPIGPHKRPRLADSFLAPGSGARGIPRVARPAIRRVAAMRRKERGPRRLSPALRGGKGIAGSPRAFTALLLRRKYVLARGKMVATLCRRGKRDASRYYGGPRPRTLAGQTTPITTTPHWAIG